MSLSKIDATELQRAAGIYTVLPYLDSQGDFRQLLSRSAPVSRSCDAPESHSMREILVRGTAGVQVF